MRKIISLANILEFDQTALVEHPDQGLQILQICILLCLARQMLTTHFQERNIVNSYELNAMIVNGELNSVV